MSLTPVTPINLLPSFGRIPQAQHSVWLRISASVFTSFWMEVSMMTVELGTNPLVWQNIYRHQYFDIFSIDEFVSAEVTPTKFPVIRRNSAWTFWGPGKTVSRETGRPSQPYSHNHLPGLWMCWGKGDLETEGQANQWLVQPETHDMEWAHP